MVAETQTEAVDQLPGFPHPRESQRLYGHQQAEQQFVQAFRADRLHHAWLLLGKEGIGKATLAYRFARRVLARRTGEGGDVSSSDLPDPANRDMQLVTNDAHPNLLVLRRSWNAKTKKYAAQIAIDNVRELQRFLGNTAGMGKWRVVIVDSADDLNVNAANALLKMLEEPPAFCLFLLLSSEPGKLPATIRSRCHKLRLEPLDEKTLGKAITQIAGQVSLELPKGEDWHRLLSLAQGSVRQGLLFADGPTFGLVREIEQLLDLLPRVDPLKSVEMAERLAGRNQDQNYHSFVNLLASRLSNRIRQIVLNEKGDRRALAQWTRLWETIISKKDQTDRLNLDRGNFILELFAQMEETAARYGGLKL